MNSGNYFAFAMLIAAAFYISVTDAQTGPCMNGGLCPANQTCVNNQCYSNDNTTVAPTCVDKAASGRPSDCPQLAYLCSNTIYYDLMTEQCPKTCNRCNGASTTATSSTCFDKAAANRVSDCPQRAYLCQNALYLSLMRDQCPKTCGYC